MIKFLWGDKDGGPESNVTCYGIELKKLFSILVLKFDYGSRNAYHSHAFYSISWLLSGGLVEFVYGGPDYKVYIPSLIPIWISRKRTHKVYGTYQANWVLSFRGPWKNTWIDIEPTKTNVLTHGRKVINESPD